MKSGPFESNASPLVIGASPRRAISVWRNSGASGCAFAMARSRSIADRSIASPDEGDTTATADTAIAITHLRIIVTNTSLRERANSRHGRRETSTQSRQDAKKKLIFAVSRLGVILRRLACEALISRLPL